MLSANNILSPAHGRPLVTPTQDMIIGAYYLTEAVKGDKGEGRVFGSIAEALQAYENGDITAPRHHQGARRPRAESTGLREGTMGRFLFDECLPPDFGFIDETVKKKQMGEMVERLANEYPKAVVATSLDAIKDLCFGFAARSGLTISIDDVTTPVEKRAILERARARGRQGRAAVPPRHHHRRRAAPEGGGDLDQRHGPGPRGDGDRPSPPSSSTPST